MAKKKSKNSKTCICLPNVKQQVISNRVPIMIFLISFILFTLILSTMDAFRDNPNTETGQRGNVRWSVTLLTTTLISVMMVGLYTILKKKNS